MRKLLSLLTLLVMVCSLPGNAKVVNFETNDIKATYMTYMVTEFSPAIIEWQADGTASATLPDNKGVNVNLNKGYISQYISVNGEEVVKSFTGSFYITPDMLPDGCTVEVMTSVQQQTNVIIKGLQDQIKVKYMYHVYEAYEWSNGELSIPITDNYLNVEIEARSGYGLKSVFYKDEDVLNDDITKFTIYSNNLLPGDNVFEVNSFLLDDERTSYFTMDITGDPSSIEVVRAGDPTNIMTGDVLEKPIRFNPDFDLPLTVRNVHYNQELYKVMVGNVDIPAVDYTYRILELKDGDVIKVDVDYPDVLIPVRLDFVNPETEGAISKVSLIVNGKETMIPESEWREEGWSVPMGAVVYISLDVTNFEVAAYLNGVEVNAGQIYFIAKDEAGYDVRVVAEPYDPFIVTFQYAELPAHFKVRIGLSSYEYIDMTGEDSTRVKVPRNRNRVRIIPDEGWVISGVVVDGRESSSEDIPITNSGMTIDVYMEEFARDLEAVFYIDPSTEWDFKSITLSPEVSFREKAIPLEPGYNMVKYSELDLPLAMDVVYQAQYDYTCFLNGVQLPTPVTSLEALTPGSVVRCYGEYPAFYDVRFTLSEEAPVTVYRDILDLLDAPGEMEVMAGTLFDIIPDNPDATIVSVGGVVQTPSDGKYTITVDSDVEIEVKKGNLSGISEIGGEGHADVFSLQGIRILKNATSSEIRNLPAGIYIVAGRKRVVK